MTESQSVAVLIETNPGLVLVDKAKFDELLGEMRREVEAHVPDVTTDKGRKAIAALAYKVARTKTAIDDAGKLLNEEARAKINVVDAARREIKATLDALKDEARKPLTDWEEAEKARIARVKEITEVLQGAGVITMDDTVGSLTERLADVQAVTIDDADYQEYAAIATTHRTNAIHALTAGIARLEKEDADRAELERLRAEDAARVEREAQDAARDQMVNDTIDYIKQVGMGFIGGKTYPYPILIRELEEKIVVDGSFGRRAEEVSQLLADTLGRVNAAFEKHMAEAEERSQREAADAARLAAHQQAEAKAAEKEKAHQAALAAAQRRADDAEAAQRAEAQRIADAKAAAEAETKRVADEDAARARDRAHKSKVLTAAKDAIQHASGIDEATAKKIVLAIQKGLVPNVTLRF